MKLSDKERKAVAMMRLLHSVQREDLLALMERQVVANRIANRVTMRVGQLSRLKITANQKVAKAFGKAPRPATRRKPKREG